MTDEEIAAAIIDNKNAIKVYINDSDSTKSLAAIQLVISALITNAGSLENLTMLKAALDAKFGVVP